MTKVNTDHFKRPVPTPPSPVPWFTLAASVIVYGLYAWLEVWWMAWLGLGLAPFLLALLPLEISDFLNRRRICLSIKRDFIESSAPRKSENRRRFLAALREDMGSAEPSGVPSGWCDSDFSFQKAGAGNTW